MTEIPIKAINRLTGKPYGFPDDSDAGLIPELGEPYQSSDDKGDSDRGITPDISTPLQPLGPALIKAIYEECGQTRCTPDWIYDADDNIIGYRGKISIDAWCE